MHYKNTYWKLIIRTFPQYFIIFFEVAPSLGPLCFNFFLFLSLSLSLPLSFSLSFSVTPLPLFLSPYLSFFIFCSLPPLQYTHVSYMFDVLILIPQALTWRRSSGGSKTPTRRDSFSTRDCYSTVGAKTSQTYSISGEFNFDHPHHKASYNLNILFPIKWCNIFSIFPLHIVMY